MVDLAIYKQMHPPTPGEPPPRPLRDDLGTERMAQEEPSLGDDFYMCLPTTVNGFNMQKKEWGTFFSTTPILVSLSLSFIPACLISHVVFFSPVSLEVGHLQDVQWNEKAFELLVIDKETKELVKAVVTNQVNAEDQADVIRGKGNGLFILLHG